MTQKNEPEFLNPRYAGATPEQVALAVARHMPEAERESDGDKPPEATAPADVRSSI